MIVRAGSPFSCCSAQREMIHPAIRRNWRAERPGVCVVTRYTAQNHNLSGILDRCMTVPAVTDA